MRLDVLQPIKARSVMGARVSGGNDWFGSKLENPARELVPSLFSSDIDTRERGCVSSPAGSSGHPVQRIELLFSTRADALQLTARGDAPGRESWRSTNKPRSWRSGAAQMFVR